MAGGNGGDGGGWWWCVGWRRYEGKGPWADGEAVRRFDGERGLECGVRA